LQVRIHEQYGPDGAVVVGISSRERAEDVAFYADSLGLTFPILLDADGSVDRLYDLEFAFPTGAYPQDFVVGADGRIVYASNEPDVEAIEAAVAEELEGG
jgi:peroxiredoxin